MTGKKPKTGKQNWEKRQAALLLLLFFFKFINILRCIEIAFTLDKPAFEIRCANKNSLNNININGQPFWYVFIYRISIVFCVWFIACIAARWCLCIMPFQLSLFPLYHYCCCCRSFDAHEMIQMLHIYTMPL